MMNIASDPGNAPSGGRWPLWQRTALGGLFGAACGYGGLKLAQRWLPAGATFQDLSPAQGAAFLLGFIALMVGLICLAMSYSRRLYESENWTAEAGPDEHRQIAPQLRLSAIALLAMGAEFVALGLPVEPMRAPLVIGAVIAALLIQLWVNWRVWQNSDELHRAIVLEGSTVSLALILSLLTVWAPLALYGLVGFDPLSIILLVSLLCIIPTIWLTVRRGMMT